MAEAAAHRGPVGDPGAGRDRRHHRRDRRRLLHAGGLRLPRYRRQYRARRERHPAFCDPDRHRRDADASGHRRYRFDCRWYIPSHVNHFNNQYIPCKYASERSSCFLECKN